MRETGDFRFEIDPVPEPEMGCTHLVRVIDIDTGDLLESFTTDDPYGAVEAAREVQAIQDERHPDGTPVYALERLGPDQ